MANFDSLKQAVNESKQTHASAAKTIRSLIQQRNDALAAANPEDVKTARAETLVTEQSKTLQGELELARQDTEDAIKEANATPVIVPKPKPAPAAVPVFPRTLADGTGQNRPAKVVDNARDESAARAEGFTVSVPAAS
jgi:hypothetical protein